MFNKIIYSHGGDELQRQHEPIIPHIQPHDHSCQDEYDCSYCDRERLRADQMWKPDQCNECREESRCPVCRTFQDEHLSYCPECRRQRRDGRAPTTHAPTEERARLSASATSTVAALKKALSGSSSPQASDEPTPESLGWQCRPQGDWWFTKSHYFAVRGCGGWWVGDDLQDGLELKPDGTFGKKDLAFRFRALREADALLFPKTQREFKPGDLVECLPDVETERSNHGLRAFMVGRKYEVRFIVGGGMIDMPDIENADLIGVGCNWPTRALRLVKAADA